MERKQRFSSIVECEIGDGTVIYDQVNLYKCKIGRNCKIDSFTYIEEGVKIGDYCKVRPFVFIPTGVEIGDYVFIGPNVTFTNDKYPRIQEEWTLLKTIIEDHVSIGANTVIVAGVKIGKNSLIGAGSVITKSVPSNSVVVGLNRILRARSEQDWEGRL